MSIPKPKKYISDFEQLGFGVFVHFGLYSILNRGEWAAMHTPGLITEGEYRKLIEKFNPDSMENLVADIKKSGAKYITLTTRHHDGFSLYDTCGLSTFDAPHSAAKRDIVKEFVDACHKYDIVPFFYHTVIEWWHPDFNNNFNKYLEYLRNSVEVLCTNYGKIGGFWFDGTWDKEGEGDIWQEEKLYAMIRKYQPDSIIINNTGLKSVGKYGNHELDAIIFERANPKPINREGMDKYITGEVCDSINMHWGQANDINFKSPKSVIETLCHCREVGANYLFNVGPDEKGTLPIYPKAVLETIGKWMEIFGTAIFNGRPFWHKDGISNFVLRDSEHVYFFYIDLLRKGSPNVVAIYLSRGREGKYVFDNFDLQVNNIRWIDNNETLDFEYENNNLEVNFTGYDYGTDYCVRVAIGDIVK